MHVHIIDIVLVYSFVFLGCESDEALVVDVDSKGIAACDEGVNSHVEF